MDITVGRFVAELREMEAKGNWFLYEDSRYHINQHFLTSRDLDGLRSFYTEALNEMLSAEELRRSELIFEAIRDLTPKIELLIFQAKQLAEMDSRTKAIYFEYDGDQLQIFLCSKYDALVDDWASEVLTETSFVPLELHELLYSWGWEASKEVAVARAIDAELLVGFLSSAIHARIESIPLGFAEHDNKIVSIEKLWD